jgi:hypothetical protein
VKFTKVPNGRPGLRICTPLMEAWNSGSKPSSPKPIQRKLEFWGSPDCETYSSPQGQTWSRICTPLIKPGNSDSKPSSPKPIQKKWKFREPPDCETYPSPQEQAWAPSLYSTNGTLGILVANLVTRSPSKENWNSGGPQIVQSTRDGLGIPKINKFSFFRVLATGFPMGIARPHCGRPRNELSHNFGIRGHFHPPSRYAELCSNLAKYQRWLGAPTRLMPSL